jgi:hypothetical protein
MATSGKRRLNQYIQIQQAAAPEEEETLQPETASNPVLLDD